jgi:hypothetical protein
MAGLGVTKTHSRPHVSDDNPFSEAQFKTSKYRPDRREAHGRLDQSAARGGGKRSGATLIYAGSVSTHNNQVSDKL